ncbi:MAG TPA: secondary thiamine-phosphate synthase enzyme [Ruminococcaceae bacterium]|nr:secondary thiamine-phosphate synthase enzyme [Oscillospiraceae bacterium]
MKHYRQVLTITTDESEQFLNLSYEVEECVRRSMINEGICVVASQHTTSSVFLENDNDCLYHDWKKFLDKTTKVETEYEVDYINKGVQHLKQILLGSTATIPVSDGKLDLGPRQYIMYADFDGMREKYVIVKIIGE